MLAWSYHPDLTAMNVNWLIPHHNLGLIFGTIEYTAYPTKQSAGGSQQVEQHLWG